MTEQKPATGQWMEGIVPNGLSKLRPYSPGRSAPAESGVGRDLASRHYIVENGSMDEKKKP